MDLSQSNRGPASSRERPDRAFNMTSDRCGAFVSARWATKGRRRAMVSRSVRSDSVRWGSLIAKNPRKRRHAHKQRSCEALAGRAPAASPKGSSLLQKARSQRIVLCGPLAKG